MNQLKFIYMNRETYKKEYNLLQSESELSDESSNKPDFRLLLDISKSESLLSKNILPLRDL